MNGIARVLLLMLAIVTLQGCCFPTSAQGAAKARALTQEQLATLYTQMESYKGTHVTWGKHHAALPEEFSRVGALYGDVGHFNRLVFGGCWDDKATLFFGGLRGNGPKQIDLAPGEWQSSEVLWRAPDESSAQP